MSLALGIDGGGTRTRAVLVAPDGAVVGAGWSGPTNFHDAPPEVVGARLAAARDAALRMAGRRPEDVGAAVLGLAGVTTDAERRAATDLARRHLDLALLEVHQDLAVAWAGALGGRPGIVVIAGTGSACYGRRADGASWRAAGWGSVLDDPGSGFDLGRRALQALLHAHDGRGPPTALRAALLAALAVADPAAIPGLLQRGDLSRARIAALAPLVTAAVRAGDGVARDLLRRSVADLAAAVAAVARRLEFAAPEVACTGGLAGSGAPYADALAHAIRAAVPGAELVPPFTDPARGAALLALALGGAPASPAVRERLRASPVPPSPARPGTG